MNKDIICYYNFIKNTQNSSSSKNKIDLIFKDQPVYYECGCMYTTESIKIEDSYVIAFDYKLPSIPSSDWCHIFSYGKHASYAGADYPHDSYIAAIKNIRNGNTNNKHFDYLENKVDLTKWHTFVFAYDHINKTYSLNIDDEYSKVLKDCNMSYLNCFYLNGMGSTKTFTAYMKNFKVILGIAKYSVTNKYLYKVNNCIYGIKKENE